MKKTKDEILMVALGVKHFTSLEMWQKEQLYYAMDEWNEDKPLSVCVALILAACATAQGRPA